MDDSESLREKVKRLEAWVSDLQSKMYVNCVYCGHRYGPKDEVPVSMAEALKEHIEVCPEHPASKLKAENDRLLQGISDIISMIEGIRFPSGSYLEIIRRKLFSLRYSWKR